MDAYFQNICCSFSMLYGGHFVNFVYSGISAMEIILMATTTIPILNGAPITDPEYAAALQG